MRELFKIDKKNYKEKSWKIVRPSSRAIIIKDNKIALVHSALYDYYKFPGGGINKNETPEKACIRETKEETGLILDEASLKPYGSVFRKEKSDQGGVFIQENYYYFGNVINDSKQQFLDDYENKEGFTLEWVKPEVAIEVNKRHDFGNKSEAMIERDRRVLEMLIEEGYFKKKYSYDLRNLILFIPIFLNDLIFYFISNQSFEFYDLLRMLFFDLGISSLISVILSLFKSKKIYLTVGIIINIIFSAFSFAQLEFNHLIYTYYSLTGARGGEGAIREFILVFIKDALPEYWLSFLPIIVFALLYKYFYNPKDNKYYFTHLIVTIFCLFGLIMSFDMNITTMDIKDIYYYHSNYEAIVSKLGINHFFIKDLSAVIVKPKEKEIVIIPEPEKPTQTISYIDDTKWLEAIENETDPTIKQIDEYLINRVQEDKNEYSGILKGKNFIYIMVESLDYLAIDPLLTPTLYKMYSEGMSFVNHYTPMYICATGDSELVGINSYIPYVDACAIHFDQDNDYATSLAYLFKNADYKTFAYHNWIDEFYDRHTLNNKEGFDSYKDFMDLGMKEVQGWQSDSELFKIAYDEFSKEDHYFAFLVTSTMHFTYTDPSYYGDKYLDKVQEIYPDLDIDFQRYLSKCIEFDKALEVLINNLKADGQLENTTICLFGDHRPYMLKDDRIIANCKIIDRTKEYGASLGPFIIYDSTLGKTVVENVCSTLDQAPTIANLFGLNYDSRLYMGSDIFNNKCIVIFRNSDWITNDGVYHHLSKWFNDFDENKLDKDEIEKINNKVISLYSISRSILKNNYFKVRDFIANPTIKEQVIIIETEE